MMAFVVAAQQRLIFTDEAVQQLRAHAQRTRQQTEAGGALLGRHLLDSPDLVVDEVTVPQKADRRSRFFFFRSRQHEEVARTKWAEAKGTLAYLGLWHTHPETDPVPSSVDRRDWEKAVAQGTFEGDRLFFLIVGTERMRVWTKARAQPIQELHAVGGEDV
jgi:integrative and conjugative element protein (TIGR02256 family)